MGSTFLFLFPQKIPSLIYGSLKKFLSCPSKTLNLDTYIAHVTSEKTRTLAKTNDANLDCGFVKDALVFIVPKIGKPEPSLEPPNLKDVFMSIPETPFV